MKANFDFGKKILIIFFFALPFILFNSCEHLLDAPSIPGGKTVAGGSISAPTGLTATKGLRQKIILSWNAVEGAKRYYIYKASNPNEEFVQVGETAEISYEMKVSAGSTDYYRVVAEKADGTRSSISAMSDAGASLARPVFSGADVDTGEITVYWYMENAGYYKDALCFDVKQTDTNTGITISRTFSGNDQYSCTFEDLNTNSKYTYSVDAYLKDSPDDRENSGESSVETMALRRPQPPKFTASEGEFKDKIRLSITLPSKVTVSIDSDVSGVIETEYPVYFEISRKRGEKGSYEVIEKALYYDGSVDTAEKKGAASGYDGYVTGNTLVWDDTKFTEQDRGVKYEYKIKSYIDYNFKRENGSPVVGSQESQPSVGWLSQRPKFAVKGEMSVENQYSVALDMAWDAMGKEKDYKFAIKLEKKEANLSAGSGEIFWLANGEGKNFFDASIKTLKEEYAIDDKMYCYTLYVAKAQVSKVEELASQDNYLEAVEASPILVADPASVPNSAFSVDDGYANKVVLKLDCTNDDDVSYKFVRKLNGEEKTIGDVTFADGIFTDTDVEGGKKYEYVMYATKAGKGISVPSEAKEAVTLGKPAPNIVTEGDGKKKLGYDTIDLEMYEVFGAKSYCLTLGESGGFGGGQTLTFDAAGKKTSGSMDADISLGDQKFTITIKKPHGYNDATLAGKAVSLEVAARGYDGETGNADKESKGSLADAKVMGPAALNVSGTDSNNVDADKITLTWNKVEDAAGYAVVRKRDGDGGNDVFYVNSDNLKVSLADTTAESAALCKDVIDVKYEGDKYTFVDDGAKATSPYEDSWYENQKKICWGYEYTYTVLPLLAEGDAGQMLGGEGTDGFAVKYEGLNEANKKVASGYTYGYGLDVKASKADYANKIKVSWKMPKYARENNNVTFKLYYKKAVGDGNLHAYDKSLTPVIKGGNAEVEFIVEQHDGVSEQDAQTSIARNDIMEYVVKYNPANDNFRQPYLNYLKSTKDGDIDEPINRGYCFALTQDENGLEDISDHEGYEEKLRWQRYPNNRAVGPDGYRLYLKNHNISGDWHLIASFDKDGSSLKAESQDADNIDVSEGGSSASSVSRVATVKPSDPYKINGLLKVLRDYKHYYRIEAYRKNSEGVEIRTSIGGSGADYYTRTAEDGTKLNGYDYGDTKEVYAYRQITDEELVRAATLAMAVGMENSRPKSSWNRTGGPDKTYYPTTQGCSGSVYTKWHAMSYQIHTITFNSCVMDMKTKSGDTVASFLNLAGSITGSLENNFARSIPPQSYNGTITVSNVMNNEIFTLRFDEAKKDSKDKLILTYAGNEEKFGNITPLPYHDQHNDEFFNDSEEWQ